MDTIRWFAAGALSACLALAGQGAALAHPGPDAVRTAAGCRARIARQPKRGRCVACVAKPRHHFHKRAAAPGFCHRNGAPAPAAAGAAVVAADTIRNKEGCEKRIIDLKKRGRCLECIEKGKLFQNQGAKGAGFCRDRPGPGAAAAAVVATSIRTPQGCAKRILRLPKRKRCLACVARGHVFQKQGVGAGFCRPPGAKSVAATVAATSIRTPEGCTKRVVAPGKRKRCLDCVSKGNIFQKQGGGAGFCRAPAKAIEIRTSEQCAKRVLDAAKRERCIKCVGGGKVFLKQGAGAGVCRPK